MSTAYERRVARLRERYLAKVREREALQNDVDPAISEPAEATPSLDLDNLTINDLRKLAKEAGIEGGHQMKKTELIDALKG